GWFGDSAPAFSVTDAASAPPAWPGDEAGDPYMARLRDRFLEAGINAGLYELWQREFMGDPLAPGRYFIGITWSAERESATAMEVSAIVYPSDEAFPARDRPADFILMRGAPVGEPPVAIELSEWNGGALGGAAPLRAAEVWTPIVVDEPISYSLWLDQAEVLEVGTLGGSPFRNHGMRLQLHLASETGGVVREAAEGGDRMIRPGGYGTGSVWEAPASGTYRLTVEARDADPENTDLAAIVSMFVFGPDPEPPVAAPATSGPPSTEIGAGEEPGDDEGRGSPLGIVISGGGAAMLLGAASTWWFRRRRKRSA
ncbi:MAG: hypothetical protein KJ698_05650, partial [Actinobacteria bacterium]|nr:hypothetical protein [Actinomycetota bacterium]